jgi:AraC family transcriptional regulator, positive regulator of tynA and feaB
MHPLIEGLRPVAASTHHLPARDKFSFWNEVICRTVVDLDCRPVEHPHFEASIGGFDAPGLGVYDIHTCPHLVYRDKAQIARLDDDALIINYVTEGSLHAEQHGRTVLLQPGDASVSDAAAPYFLAFDRPLGCVSVKVSRQEMLLRAGGIERLTAVSLSRASSLQPVVFGFLRQLIAEAPRLSPEAGSKAVAVFKELVAASLQEALRLPGAPPSEHGAVARQRIKAFIEAHLTDAALCPDSVAREMRLSTRYINRLFETDGLSLGRYIWQRRLDRCARCLADPSLAGESITSIAIGHGFNDLSHFSRVFKQRFGRSPREYRAVSFNE